MKISLPALFLLATAVVAPALACNKETCSSPRPESQTLSRASTQTAPAKPTATAQPTVTPPSSLLK